MFLYMVLRYGVFFNISFINITNLNIIIPRETVNTVSIKFVIYEIGLHNHLVFAGFKWDKKGDHYTLFQ